MRVLLVEDENNLRKIVRLNLELENYEVIEAENGKIAKEKLENEYFDIIILDIMLPYLNGIDILRFLSINNHETPVIITSAKDTSSDRILGLKSGADDYLTKPYEIEELLLRMTKLLNPKKKNRSLKKDTYSFGSNKINFKSFIGQHHDQIFKLSQKEVQLLKLLISKENEVVPRHEILKAVWGYDVFPSTRTIDNFVSALRKHFEDDPKNPKFIHSVRGVGYKFVS